VQNQDTQTYSASNRAVEGKASSGASSGGGRVLAHRKAKPLRLFWREGDIVRKGDLVLVDTVPESDPAFPIVMAILRVVPASRWAFARPADDGELGNLLGSGENDGALAELTSEVSRQREKAKMGPRIAATLGPLGIYESGVTLLFADHRATFGILTLLRTPELGPFTSGEIAMLTLALDSASEQLHTLRLHAGAHARPTTGPHDAAPDALENPEGESYVLDSDLQIVMTWTSQDQRRAALTGLRMRISERLPAVLEDTVRALISGWQSDPATRLSGVARPVPFLVVRTQPVRGAAGLFIGVRIERFKSPHSLVVPAARFRISPRELEVLGLLLDGAKLDEIGETLNITTSTVQDHIKSMVDKTGSRNRTELIARVLGWESQPDCP
jgi:DNA-binding CsgD family transcriptional regulator